MPRRRQHAPLRVYLNNRLVGHLLKEPGGAIFFRYDESWLGWENAIPVSLSLPLREDAYRGTPVVAVFENLLPDSEPLRRRVAERVGAEGSDAYSLLAAIGRDCVGALQFIAGDDDVIDATSSHRRRARRRRGHREAAAQPGTGAARPVAGRRLPHFGCRARRKRRPCSGTASAGSSRGAQQSGCQPCQRLCISDLTAAVRNWRAENLVAESCHRRANPMGHPGKAVPVRWLLTPTRALA